MTEGIEDYRGRPISCEWCGNVRDAKVRVAGMKDDTLIVCRRHFLRYTGDYVDAPTRRAIVQLFETRT